MFFFMANRTSLLTQYKNPNPLQWSLHGDFVMINLREDLYAKYIFFLKFSYALIEWQVDFWTKSIDDNDYEDCSRKFNTKYTSK